jgi:hypothetical protein
MGASIALQSAGLDQRILGVVAESAFGRPLTTTWVFIGRLGLARHSSGLPHGRAYQNWIKREDSRVRTCRLNDPSPFVHFLYS